MNPNIEKQLEEMSRAELEMRLVHRIEHYKCLEKNASLENDKTKIETYRQIIVGLNLQYFTNFKRYYARVNTTI